MSTSNATKTISLLDARATDGSSLSAHIQKTVYKRENQRTGEFQLMPTSAGGFALVSESPLGNGDTVTDTVILPVLVPLNYASGDALAIDLSVAVVSQQGDAVRPDSNISVSVSRLNSDGSVSVIPSATGAQNLPAVEGNANAPVYSVLSFAFNGTGVNPGDQLLIYVTLRLGIMGTPPFQAKTMICQAQLVAEVQNYQVA